LVGPGVLTFWWLVAVDDDSPQGADFSLELKVGSNVVERLSEAAFGSGATWFWLNRECQLPAGEQTVSWRFATLGGCTDPASGTLWLDEVGFHRAGSLQVVGTSGGRVNLDLWGSPGSRYELQFSENLEDWSAAAGSSRVTLEGGSVRLDLESAGRCGFFRAVPVGS
jgi:hypothetical protein